MAGSSGMQDVVNELIKLQVSESAQLTQLREIRRGVWTLASQRGTAAAGSGATASLASGAAPTPNTPGGGTNRSSLFGRRQSASSGVAAAGQAALGAFSPGAGAAAGQFGAAGLAAYGASQAATLAGHMVAARSDVDVSPTERSFNTAERMMSIFTLGIGSGWLKDSWNRSGWTDFRQSAGSAREQTLQIARSAHESGVSLSGEETHSIFGARYEKEMAFRKTGLRNVNKSEKRYLDAEKMDQEADAKMRQAKDPASLGIFSNTYNTEEVTRRLIEAAEELRKSAKKLRGE